MANTKKQNFLHGAVILTAGLAVIKVLGAIYKIPIANILGKEGYEELRAELTKRIQ